MSRLNLKSFRPPTASVSSNHSTPHNSSVELKSAVGQDQTPNPFIPAHKNFLGELLIFWIARRSLWRTFHAVRFRAAAPLPTPPDRLNVPVIFYANHSSWWDGYLAHIVTRQIYNLDTWLMMSVRQLQRYRFFSWAGCFSVDQTNGREAMRSIEYVAGQLQGGPGRALWIFPQGDIQPSELRPLGFHSGLARTIRRVGECYVYPVALRFEFSREQYPDILVSVGAARHFEANQRLNPRSLTTELEDTLTDDLDRLRDDATAGRLSDFVTVIRGKGSTDLFFNKVVATISRLKNF